MRVTIAKIQEMKQSGEKIVMLTAYDYSTAKIVDEAGIPLILVGDTLGMVVLGYETTLRVTMEDMIHHTKAVVRGSSQAMVIGDMPFLTYQLGESETLAQRRPLHAGSRLPGGQARRRRHGRRHG